MWKGILFSAQAFPNASILSMFPYSPPDAVPIKIATGYFFIVGSSFFIASISKGNRSVAHGM